MGQFSEADVSSGAVITATKINAILADIKNSFNSLTADNFSTATAIPVAALDTSNFEYALELAVDSVGSGVVVGTKQDYSIVPVNGSTLVAVKVFCESKAGAADPTVDLYLESSGSSVLSSAVTLAADATVYSGVISTSSFSADDVLSLRCTTDGTGSITKLRVVLLFKKQLI